jgi:hypothetical protein
MTSIRKMTLEQATEYANEMRAKLGLDPATFETVTAARMDCIDLESKMTAFDATATADVPFDADQPVPENANAAAEQSTDAGAKSKYDTSGKRGPNLGTGVYARQRIIEGADNKTILAEIHEKFPGARTSLASIAFYRNQVKQGNLASPEALRAKAAKLREEADALDAKADELAQAQAETAAEIDTADAAE